jgi:hypothetical protein
MVANSDSTPHFPHCASRNLPATERGFSAVAAKCVSSAQFSVGVERSRSDVQMMSERPLFSLFNTLASIASTGGRLARRATVGLLQ